MEDHAGWARVRFLAYWLVLVVVGLCAVFLVEIGVFLVIDSWRSTSNTVAKVVAIAVAVIGIALGMPVLHPIRGARRRSSARPRWPRSKGAGP